MGIFIAVGVENQNYCVHRHFPPLL